jgi:hypothetical protein
MIYYKSDKISILSDVLIMMQYQIRYMLHMNWITPHTWVTKFVINYLIDCITVLLTTIFMIFHLNHFRADDEVPI